jgi:hypothetical protein
LEALDSVIELYITDGKWAGVLDVAGDGKWNLFQGGSSKALRSLVEENTEHVLAKTALGLATSELLETAEASQQRRVSDYLKTHFIRDSGSWSRHTSPDVAGAAIERAGRVIDSLQFYENVIAAAVFTREQKTRARVRWVKCKFRQSDREGREQKEQMARRHATEAEERTREWGVPDVKGVPEYPQIKGFTEPIIAPVENLTEPRVEATAAQSHETVKQIEAPVAEEREVKTVEVRTSTEEHLAWSVGDLAFRYSPKAGRANIVHQRTLETATVRVAEREFTSGDVELETGKGSSLVFTCPKWQIECDLRGIEDRGFFTLRFLDTGMEIHLPAVGK